MGKLEGKVALGRLILPDQELRAHALASVGIDPARGGRTVQDIVRRFLRAREPSCAEFMLTLAQALEQYGLDQGGEQ